MYELIHSAIYLISRNCSQRNEGMKDFDEKKEPLFPGFSVSVSDYTHAMEVMV